MEKWPIISVIIPIYNVENYLSRCLESVVHQTLLDIEIVCVNDGTKDNSIGILKKYMEKDHRIQLIEKENGGVASARNAGLAAAAGELVVFLDPDDYLEKNALERIYEEYLNTSADIVIFGSVPFPEIPGPDAWTEWNLNCRDAYYPKFHPDALFREPSGNPFVWDRAFSRRFLDVHHLKFREDVQFGEDLVFLFQAMPQAKGIRFIEDKLHYYQCFRQGSFMNRYGGENERRLKQHVDNMRIITEYWHRHGFLKRWKAAYTSWFIRFIIPDLMKYRPANSKELLRDLLAITETYHLVGGRGILNKILHKISNGSGKDSF